MKAELSMIEHRETKKGNCAGKKRTGEKRPHLSSLAASRARAKSRRAFAGNKKTTK
jgi:hypothetical protein